MPTDVSDSHPAGRATAPAHRAASAGADSLGQTVPRLPRVYVPRARLWQRLDRASENPLTVLVAPAGAGKTLGVSGWLRRSGRSSEVIWLHAERRWTPARLGKLLESAAGQDEDATPSPRLVVIDDAHELPPSTLRMIDSRLNEAPLDMRLLLLSRWDLPLTKLVPELLGYSTTLRGELLRMDPAESAALVIEHARTEDPAVLRAVSDRTQGWCALVVLTARAIATAPDPIAAADRYAVGGVAVADQVATEVFAALQPPERHLLLCLAGDEIVRTATARHLSHDSRADAILADLETTGLLVSRLPSELAPDGVDDVEEPVRYRIHPLMAEVTRRRLVAGGVDVSRARATVVRAVRLDLARGDSSRALPRLMAANALDEAAAVVAEHGIALTTQGRGGSIAEFLSRHPAAVEANPECWFPIAVERWLGNDMPSATHWMDRSLPVEQTRDPTSARTACMRLMRARLGLEPMYAAVGHAQRVMLVAHRRTNQHLPELPLLLSELGITQSWLGDLAEAQVNLTTTISLCSTRDLTALALRAMTHLAFTHYMQGRESACTEVAQEALDRLREDVPWRHFAQTRATVAFQLGSLCDLPWKTVESVPSGGEMVHAADLVTRFWLRMRDARLALMSGSVSSSERTLETLIDLPPLPDHLHTVVLLERAFLASLSCDHALLQEVSDELAVLGAVGEAALARGLRDDLLGDRRAAVDEFAAAALDVMFSQPATRALALTCEAQLRDALGDHEQALDRLREAALATEVRRNAVPFLGWSHQGTPMASLLAALDRVASTPWVHELNQSAAGRPDITSAYAPTTATPRERQATLESVVRPALSPREREVLNELARGSTYADIAAQLFVSENTIKTHVSSLYGKLSVGRRSEALAVARNLHLI
ncbi:MAG TPA: LuxR C-terminal-related transcriptional regulator [Nocardioides sp.]|nr:LuxR C-terminal-related transcriptional regulator [Nocardioides sp.]